MAERENKIPTIRTPMATATYYGLKEASRIAEVEMRLKEGHTPFKPAAEYYQLVDDLGRSGRLAEAGVGYKAMKSPEVERYVRNRFNLTSKDVYVAIDSGNASDGLIVNIIKLLHHEQKKVQVWGIGPHFTGLTEAINNFRDENMPDAEERFLYAPVTTGLNSPTEKTLLKALEVRARDTRQDEDGKDILHAWYVSNLGSPRGERIDPKDLRAFIDTVTEVWGDYVIADEVLGDSLPDSESVMKLVEENTRLFALRSFSKTVGLGGARFGYAAMHKELGDKFQRLERPYGNGYTQLIVGEFVQLRDPATQELVIDRHIRQDREKTRAVKEPLMGAFSQAGIIVEGQSYPDSHIYLIRGPYGENLAHSLDEVGVLAAPGEGFGETHPDLKFGSHVRMSIPPEIGDIPRVVELTVKAL